MDYCVGYITAKDKEEALGIGRTLVEKHLAACANVIAGMESVYRWEGKVESAKEAVLIIKTTIKAKDKVLSVVKAMHSYSCPCVVFYKLDGGNPDYLKWIGESVS